jgi:hypothetical protein
MGISYSVSYIQILAVFPLLIIALAFFRSSEKKVQYFRDNPEEAKREIEKVKEIEQKNWKKDHPILNGFMEFIGQLIFSFFQK